MSNRRKGAFRPRRYRSDDLIEILAEEIPSTERVLCEVLGLLVRRKVLLNPRASLGGGASAPAEEQRAAEAPAPSLWDQTRFLVNPLEMIASIICETYAEAGEDAVFADDEALIMIRDLLLEVDATIVERTRGTNSAARDRRWQWLAEKYKSSAAERPVPAAAREEER